MTRKQDGLNIELFSPKMNVKSPRRVILSTDEAMFRSQKKAIAKLKGLLPLSSMSKNRDSKD